MTMSFFSIFPHTGRHHDSSDSQRHKIYDYSSDDHPGRVSDGQLDSMEIPHPQKRHSVKYRSPTEPSPRRDSFEEKLPDHRHLYASMTTLTSGTSD